MGYYMAGDYYMAGGLFSSIGKALGGVVKTVGGAVGGFISTGSPLGALGGALRGAGIIKAPTGPIPIQAPPTGLGPPIIGIPGLPPTATGLPPGTTVNKQGMLVKKRRRMNPANPRALKRAIRREESFVRLARRALKGSKYTVTTRGGRRPRADLPPGHRHVR